MQRPHRSLQEDLITLLCHSDEHGRLVANLALPEHFEGDYRVIAERALIYWQEYKRAPRAHTANLISDILEEEHDRRAPTFRRLLMSMAELQASINTTYVINQLRLFKRLQELKGAILTAADQLQSGTEFSLQQAQDVLNDILHVRDVIFDPGLRLDDPTPLLHSMDERGAAEFTTGVEAFDRAGIAPKRGSIMLLLAATNKGKSWWLTHLGRRAMMYRKKVLHITLEMRDIAVMQRYYQGLFVIPNYESGKLIEQTTLHLDGDRDIVGIGVARIELDFSWASELMQLELMSRVQEKAELLKYIRIKQFPRGSLSLNGLRGYLDMMESVEHFTPDMLIIDYPAIMKLDPNNLRISMGALYNDLAGLLVERNMAGAFVHQLSRAGADARAGKLTHVAEDWSVVQTVDDVIVYSQTRGEAARGLARLGVDKARSTAGKFNVLITQSYRTGQFVLQSGRMPSSYSSEKANIVEDDNDKEDENSD